MRVHPTAIPDVLLLEPTVHGDARGFFMESYNRRAFAETVGRDVEFVQDNHSLSAKGVLRGLHYQVPPHAQAKLVRVAEGEIFDVAVDLRRASPTFGRWTGETLSADNRLQLWIPEGFAHGFVTLSETAQVLYKASAYYSAPHERSLAWDDADLGIDWSGVAAPLLSAKDAAAPQMRDADLFD
ncbi:MAG TPA: dTDP-4-dehydrorhamnose 3,5-epimerase [Allosphingosinicella sp.]